MHIRTATTADYPTMMLIWESAVKATHHFLAAEDFQLFKTLIPQQFFPQVDTYVLEDDGIKGFIGVAGNHLEMLFVDAAVNGKGYGKILLLFALEQLCVTHVDVNEQNEQAVGFYLKMGFTQAGRSEKDGMGKDYPLLHLVYVQ